MTAATVFFTMVPIDGGDSVLASSPGTGLLFARPEIFATAGLVLGRRRRWPRVLAAILIAPIGVLVFSVGLFYWPGIALMGIAALAPSPPAAEPEPAA